MKPTQSAYKPKLRAVDASLTLLDTMTWHLDSPHTFVMILFIDFSSAFNTVNINTNMNHLQSVQAGTKLVLGLFN